MEKGYGGKKIQCISVCLSSGHSLLLLANIKSVFWGVRALLKAGLEVRSSQETTAAILCLTPADSKAVGWLLLGLCEPSPILTWLCHVLGLCDGSMPAWHCSCASFWLDIKRQPSKCQLFAVFFPSFLCHLNLFLSEGIKTRRQK